MYTYARLLEDLSYLSYCGLDVGSVGVSALKNDIPYVHVGDYSSGQAIITGGIHARENITSLLVMRQAFRTALCAKPLEGGIYFIPMVNPDGALLIEKGVDIASDCNTDRKVSTQNMPYSKNNGDSNNNCDNGRNNWADFLRSINGGDDFRLWKANINGVDLNNNFGAKFGKGIGQKTAPAPQGYHGEYAFSEPETRALRDFTIKVQPQITLSYHALGQELYWNFFQNQQDYDRDKKIADEINGILGYKIVDDDMGSTGGYKDWCIDFLKIPALTVEIIDACYAHPLGDIDPDWQQNKDIPYALAEIVRRLHSQKVKTTAI